MADSSLSFGVPMDVIVDHDNDSYVLVCHEIPMLLAGKGLDGLDSHVRRALDLVANYLLTLGDDAASAYLKRRGVQHTFIEKAAYETPLSPAEPKVFHFGGGVLAHA